MTRSFSFIFGLFVLLTLSTPKNSFSQDSTSFTCNSYPTSDHVLNEHIRSLVTVNSIFDSRMKTLFENITVADQEVASSYIKTSNLALFDVFPQFNDAELANSLSSFRDKYSIVWIKHCELYPGIDSIQRREEIKRITECATGKIKLEEFELLRLADDPCETQRRNCIASVSAEAAVMHMGCAALDLSIIGGIICHGAAFAYQWTAGNNCNINAQLCREGRIKNTQH